MIIQTIPPWYANHDMQYLFTVKSIFKIVSFYLSYFHLFINSIVIDLTLNLFHYFLHIRYFCSQNYWKLSGLKQQTFTN